MRSSEDVAVTRDVEATVIPAGTRVLIPQGVTVTITQALGGSYTVITPQGYQARVEGKDADALGKAPPAPEPRDEGPIDPAELEKRVWDKLRTVYDPEIPVSIVELGLVYECKLTEGERGTRVEVQMTLTAPGCSMGDVLKAEAEDKVKSLPGISEARVELVWDPPWDPSRMSEAARLELGFG